MHVVIFPLYDVYPIETELKKRKCGEFGTLFACGHICVYDEYQVEVQRKKKSDRTLVQNWVPDLYGIIFVLNLYQVEVEIKKTRRTNRKKCGDLGT